MISSPKKRLLTYWSKVWGEALDAQQKNKIKVMLESGGLIFYFRYNNNIYGASEGSRVIFAKMKDPADEDHSTHWMKEANFLAVNLNALGQGKQEQMIFGEKELNDIDVLSKDEALLALEDFFEREKQSS